jgi:L-alanine-DL-glutamate epimerase-like enolase superfamily enzyme
MIITSVRPVLLTHPYGIPGAHISRRSVCLVEVTTDDGVVGLGETYAGVYAPEVAAQIVTMLTPDLVGKPIAPVTRHRELFWKISYWGRTGLPAMVLGAIELALWDALGQQRGLPVHELLGGAVHDRIGVYASGGVPSLTLDQLVAQAHQIREQGFRGFKMRANPLVLEPDVLEERVAAVREALGADQILAVDSVANFRVIPASVRDIARALDRLTPYDIAWAEEFLPPFDPAPYAELRAMTRTPISGGEGITSVAEAAQWLRAGAFDLYQPDPTIIGGIAQARQACDLAAAASVPIATHVWGCAPAVAANHHLAFTQPHCTLVEHPVMDNPLQDALTLESFDPDSDGYARPPTAPGFGVRLTPEIEAAYPYQPGSESAFG